MADNNFRGWVFKRESKNKNLSVCTKASTIEALSNIAAESEMNRNELVNEIFESFIDDYYEDKLTKEEKLEESWLDEYLDMFKETEEGSEEGSEADPLKCLEEAIQTIDDFTMDYIEKNGRLIEVEGYIRAELGTIFNKAFRRECEKVTERDRA